MILGAFLSGSLLVGFADNRADNRADNQLTKRQSINGIGTLPTPKAQMDLSPLGEWGRWSDRSGRDAELQFWVV